MWRKVGLVLVVAAAAAVVYQCLRPPPPRKCGSDGGPAVTAARIRLRDGRYIAYKESGVPKQTAKFKIVFAHPFDSCRLHNLLATQLPQKTIEEMGVYTVAYDRAGYGESDAHPQRTVKSMALDVEDLADQLGLGPKFYVIGFSMGGHTIWGTLKYIPHRLAGAALLAPVVNYWWTGLPANLTKEAYNKQLPQDHWTLRVHYLPWLTYWWNTQKWFPASSVIAGKRDNLNRQDLELVSKMVKVKKNHRAHVRQQGEYESIHRDMIIGFGTWEFSPLDLTNPFPNNEGSVHLWQGDEDGLVPVTLQRYIAKRLPWIKYHEKAGAGHLFPLADGMVEVIVKSLLLGQESL